MKNIENFNMEQLNYYKGRLAESYKNKDFAWLKINKEVVGADEVHVMVLDTENDVMLFESQGGYEFLEYSDENMKMEKMIRETLYQIDFLERELIEKSKMKVYQGK